MCACSSRAPAQAHPHYIKAPTASPAQGHDPPRQVTSVCGLVMLRRSDIQRRAKRTQTYIHRAAPIGEREENYIKHDYKKQCWAGAASPKSTKTPNRLKNSSAIARIKFALEVVTMRLTGISICLALQV